MARTKTGYINLTVTVPQDVADRLDDIHWRVRREVSDILVDAVTEYVEAAEASLGEA